MRKIACFFLIFILIILIEVPYLISGQKSQNGRTARQLYLENCAACHGRDRSGFIGTPLVPAKLAARSEAAIRSLILYGIENTLMPVWSCRLTQPQMRQLAFYLKETPAEIVRKVTVDSDGRCNIAEIEKWWRDSQRIAKGEVLFEEYCMGCHHQTIEAFAPSFGEIAGNRDVTAIAGQIKFPWSSSAILGYTDQKMPVFGLTDSEIKNLGAYVHSFRE